MVEKDLLISNRLGLHARAAARFVHLASGFSSRIKLRKDSTEVDGKSILGILALAAVQGTRLRLRCEGEDEQQAAERLCNLVVQRFGEES
jgi:phosphocarrier protein